MWDQSITSEACFRAWHLEIFFQELYARQFALLYAIK